jgi:hypothetical protein
MARRFLAIACFAIASLGAGAAQPDMASRDSLDVYVMLPRTGGVPGVDILLGGTVPQVRIVLKNIGSETIRVWKDNCSRGYRNVSFEMIDKEGRRFVVQRAPITWEKNIPAWDTLAAGDSVSREITFKPHEWRGLPELRPGEARSVKMRAIYTSADSYDAQHDRVWVGTVSSEPAEVTLANNEQ